MFVGAVLAYSACHVWCLVFGSNMTRWRHAHMVQGMSADGWFTELSTMWPGQGMSIKVNEVLFKGRSEFQVGQCEPTGGGWRAPIVILLILAMICRCRWQLTLPACKGAHGRPLLDIGYESPPRTPPPPPL